MGKRHVWGAALLLAASSVIGVGTAAASAAPEDSRGGEPFDGANLRDGSVSYSKLNLLTGDIPASKVDGVVSQPALDQLAADLGGQLDDVRTRLSAVENRDGAVHWSEVLGRPSGFADGVDDVDGGIAGNLLCGGACVDGGEIVDGSVSAVDLAGRYDDMSGAEAQPGAVTSAKILDRTVELRDLSNEVLLLLHAADAALAEVPADVSVPAETRQTVVLDVAAASPGDFLSVSPPSLPGTLLFAGARVSEAGRVAVEIYNPAAGAQTLPASTLFQVFTLDLAA